MLQISSVFNGRACYVQMGRRFLCRAQTVKHARFSSPLIPFDEEKEWCWGIIIASTLSPCPRPRRERKKISKENQQQSKELLFPNDEKVEAAVEADGVLEKQVGAE